MTARIGLPAKLDSQAATDLTAELRAHLGQAIEFDAAETVHLGALGAQ